MRTYMHSLHEGYDGLDPLEREFAEALDRLGSTWCRNPSRSGDGIPLITPGTTSTFYPDFLVWRPGAILAIDTTGGHLLADKSARKLLTIQVPPGAETQIVIRFVGKGGRWSASPQPAQEDSEGFTVWELTPNQERRRIHVQDVDGAVLRAVRSPR